MGLQVSKHHYKLSETQEICEDTLAGLQESEAPSLKSLTLQVAGRTRGDGPGRATAARPPVAACSRGTRCFLRSGRCSGRSGAASLMAEQTVSGFIFTHTIYECVHNTRTAADLLAETGWSGRRPPGCPSPGCRCLTGERASREQRSAR